MAIAVASCRICYVYFEDEKLVDWALSRKASLSPKNAAKQARTWIEMLEPDVVVTEKLGHQCRKGTKSETLIEAVQKMAAEFELFDVAVSKRQLFDNKYEEAAFYAARFPDIKNWLPEMPKIWEGEPYNASYIEAINLALQIVDASNREDPK
ncbi:MAG: hypothetical protein AAFQ10_03905 [Pseudomonadota bacterium]